MVNQIGMASIMPIDGTATPAFPYYSSTANSYYAQALTLPIPSTNDSGMLGKVDDRLYRVKADNVYNFLQNTSYPLLNID